MSTLSTAGATYTTERGSVVEVTPGGELRPRLFRGWEDLDHGARLTVDLDDGCIRWEHGAKTGTVALTRQDGEAARTWTAAVQSETSGFHHRNVAAMDARGALAIAHAWVRHERPEHDLARLYADDGVTCVWEWFPGHARAASLDELFDGGLTAAGRALLEEGAPDAPTGSFGRR